MGGGGGARGRYRTWPLTHTHTTTTTTIHFAVAGQCSRRHARNPPARVVERSLGVDARLRMASAQASWCLVVIVS